MSHAFPLLGQVEPKKELDSSKFKPLPNFRSGLQPQNNYLKNEGIKRCKTPATAPAASPSIAQGTRSLSCPSTGTRMLKILFTNSTGEFGENQTETFEFLCLAFTW